jgi:hypothetical protein
MSSLDEVKNITKRLRLHGGTLEREAADLILLLDKRLRDLHRINMQRAPVGNQPDLALND